MRLRYFIAVVCSITGPVGPTRADLNLDQLLGAYRSAHDSIRSMHALVTLRIEYSANKRPPQMATCEWWQDGKRVRYVANLSEDLSGGARRHLSPLERSGAIGETGTRSMLVGLSREGNQRLVSGTVDDPLFDPGPYTPWAIGLFELNNATHAFYDVALTKGRDKLKNLEMSWGDGLSTVSFEDKDNVAYEVVFDPAVNYLVRRRRMYVYGPDRKTHEQPYDEEVKEFKEIAPGVFFPARTEIRLSGKSGLKWIGRSTIELKMVNGQIPEEQLALDFPAGVGVDDHKDQIYYRVGENGEKTQVRPLGSIMFGSAGRPGTPAWRGFMGGTFVVAGLAVFGLLVRRRRAVRAGA